MYSKVLLQDKRKCICINSCYRQLCFYAGAREQVDKISSCGMDGRIVIWDLKVSIPFFRKFHSIKPFSDFLK
eukprot:Seg6742.1 transcript_id=Seg6742.1/GoldUCD/mRNA.D3Y31 product="hypothetical protein" pseudo=true protein_id=Seg6742.1/GoldUCD/D3Y31